MQFAVYTDSQNYDAPLMVRIEGEFTEDLVAKFPKSFGFKVSPSYLIIWNLTANATNGGVNEAAVKRLARLFKEAPECYGSRSISCNMMSETDARKFAGV